VTLGRLAGRRRHPPRAVSRGTHQSAAHDACRAGPPTPRRIGPQAQPPGKANDTGAGSPANSPSCACTRSPPNTARPACKPDWLWKRRYVSGHDSRDKIAHGASLAGRLHSDDRRQDEPYLNHPPRVALRIMCHYNVLNPDVICVALLYDVVGDHAADLSPYGQDGTLSVLADWFGPYVATLVAAVTNPPFTPGAPPMTSTATTSRPARSPARGRA
jgi:hypothetical protein